MLAGPTDVDDPAVAGCEQTFDEGPRRGSVVGRDEGQLGSVDLAMADEDEGEVLAGEPREVIRVDLASEEHASVGDLEPVLAGRVHAARAARPCRGEQQQLVPVLCCAVLDPDQERIVEVALLDREDGLEREQADDAVAPSAQAAGRDVHAVAQLAGSGEDRVPGLHRDLLRRAAQHHRHRRLRDADGARDVDLGGPAADGGHGAPDTYQH